MTNTGAVLINCSSDIFALSPTPSPTHPHTRYPHNQFHISSSLYHLHVYLHRFTNNTPPPHLFTPFPSDPHSKLVYSTHTHQSHTHAPPPPPSHTHTPTHHTSQSPTLSQRLVILHVVFLFSLFLCYLLLQHNSRLLSQTTLKESLDGHSPKLLWLCYSAVDFAFYSVRNGVPSPLAQNTETPTQYLPVVPRDSPPPPEKIDGNIISIMNMDVHKRNIKHA